MPSAQRPSGGARLRRFATCAVAVLAAVVALALAYPSLWLAGPALVDESHAMDELGATVTVRRDGFGIAHISASEEDDVWAGLGFAQAHDRACQVEMLVRVAEGTLSEWIGDVPLGASVRSVDLDRIARELDLGARAERSWRYADEGSRRRLARFAAGANARLASLGHDRPACFRLLASAPRPWRERDPLLLLELFGLVGQVPALRAQALAADLIPSLGEARVAELLPPEVLVGTSRSAVATGSPLASLLSTGGDLVSGSNAWAVRGSRSRSGGALLAADPHVIADRAPTWWYLAHVSTGGLNAQGLFLPGTPLLAVGHTRRLAWGATSTLLRTGGVEAVTSEAGLTRREASPIVTRFSTPRPLVALRRGERPVVAEPSSAHGAAARFAVDLGPSDGVRQLRGFHALLTASGVEAVEPASADLRAGPLSWSLVLADADGHIASRAAAVLPDSAGADPYARLDPPEARIVSANAAPAPLPPGPWSGAFEPSDRATRITELLDATPRHSAESFRRIQLDVRSVLARRALPALLDDLAADPTLAQLRAALAGWDGDCQRESPGCAAFELVIEALPRHTFADELGAGPWARFASVGELATRAAAQLLAEPGSPWWDDTSTTPHESRGEVVRRAAHDALDELTAEGGDEPEGWNWGASHVLGLANPLAALPVLGRHFERGPFAAAGDRYTVNAAGFAPPAGTNQRRVKLGPTSRFVIDLATPELGYFACSTGMSEDPFSGYAWNLTDPWLAGELFVESLAGPREVRATTILSPTR